MQSLNILHVFRAPVGGLFRHVLDLTREQTARGHRVGLIADSRTGGTRGDDALRLLEPSLALGLTRIPMRRHAGPGDLFALAHVVRRAAQTEADVVHGHGAKGGAYARLSFGSKRAVRAYTPHGGSLLFNHDSLAGKFYLATERLLMLRGDLFLFESAYSAAIFRNKIGNPRGLVRVVHNGVSRTEFEPIVTRPDATDLVFLGELRPVKGIDVLLDALARLRDAGRIVTATLVGDGPEREDATGSNSRNLGLGGAVHFKPAMPGAPGVNPRPHHGGAVAGGIAALCGAGGGRRRQTADHDHGRRHSGNLWAANRYSGTPRSTPAALAQAIGRALDHPDATAETARKLRERVQTSFRSIPWLTACFPPTGQPSTRCAKPAGR